MTETTSAILCAHANEMPAKCECPDDCYCKKNACRVRRKYKKKNEVKPEDEPSHLKVFLDTEYGEQGWVL